MANKGRRAVVVQLQNPTYPLANHNRISCGHILMGKDYGFAPRMSREEASLHQWQEKETKVEIEEVSLEHSKGLVP
jgi:hypothetical protein